MVGRDGMDGMGWLSLEGAIYRAPTVLIKTNISLFLTNIHTYNITIFFLFFLLHLSQKEEGKTNIGCVLPTSEFKGSLKISEDGTSFNNQEEKRCETIQRCSLKSLTSVSTSHFFTGDNAWAK